MGQPLHVKVFVSSPGDVPEERAAALKLLAELPGEAAWAGRVTIQPVMWDDPRAPAPLEANTTPQAAVNWYKGKPSDCDLTIVILAGRIGSPPDLYRKDGSRYPSGTVWEYEDAVEAGRKVWIFRRDPPPEIDIDDPALDEKRAQRAGIRAFVAAVQAGGKGGFETYANPADLAAKLAGRLATYLRSRTDQADAEPISPPPRPAAPYLVPERKDDEGRKDPVVGRGALLEDLWADLARGANCSLVFLAGVGKTTVALELVRQKVRILEKFEGVLWADLGKRPERLVQLRRWAEALKVAPELMHNLASIDDWKQVVKATIGERRLLLVLDDVWAAKDARDFSDLGDACVTLITTRLPQVATDVWHQSEIIEVEELDEAQGLELLERIAPVAVAADRDGARETVQAVQGLPLALMLVGKYLRHESFGRGDPDRIAAAFATLREASQRLTLRRSETEEGGDERTLEEIIDVSYEALPNDRARAALEHLAVFRPKPHAFTKAMAQDICGTEPALLFQLADMGLVEHAGGGAYTMHRVIAEYARKKLPRTTAEELHGKALAWYRERLTEAIEGDLSGYQSWYRYEETEWQALKDAWLYHLAASGDAVGSILAFLRVYFDAFWWWGYYQRFPFCERLIREWLQRDLGSAEREALRQLSIFQTNYPVGYEKRGRQEDWRKVERALIALRQGQGLDGDVARIAGEDARRVRHFTDFFLAECAGYGRSDRNLALARYHAAHDQFQGDGTEWIPAWLWFYVAQYLLDAGDPAAAADYTRRALAEAGEEAPLAERDPELLANIYRQLGDLALSAGDGEEALAQYRRAAFYAFIFQAVPEPADSYTVAFYREIAGRIAAQLASHHAAGHDVGELVTAVQAYWQPWWPAHPNPNPDFAGALQAADAAALEASLFPAVPAAEKVIEEAADFAKDVKAAMPALRAAAAVADDPPSTP